MIVALARHLIKRWKYVVGKLNFSHWHAALGRHADRKASNALKQTKKKKKTKQNRNQRNASTDNTSKLNTHTRIKQQDNLVRKVVC